MQWQAIGLRRTHSAESCRTTDASLLTTVCVCGCLQVLSAEQSARLQTASMTAMPDVAIMGALLYNSFPPNSSPCSLKATIDAQPTGGGQVQPAQGEADLTSWQSAQRQAPAIPTPRSQRQMLHQSSQAPQLGDVTGQHAQPSASSRQPAGLLTSTQTQAPLQHDSDAQLRMTYQQQQVRDYCSILLGCMFICNAAIQVQASVGASFNMGLHLQDLPAHLHGRSSLACFLP